MATLPGAVPQIIGWEAERAQAELTARGWTILVIETSPPRHKPGGNLRVVRQRLVAPQTIELTLASHSQLAGQE